LQFGILEFEDTFLEAAKTPAKTILMNSANASRVFSRLSAS
jgi:hypothetical protein